MAIEILITRRMSQDQHKAVKPYLSRLTSLALDQPGFISGKSLVQKGKPDQHLIICTWNSVEDWERFNALEESRELHYLIDQILVKPTQHQIFQELNKTA